MKKLLSYIFCCTLLSALLPSCSQEDDTPMESTRTMLLNINVNTRATEAADAGMPGTLQLWVYGMDQSTPLLYRKYGKVNWKKVEGTVGEDQPEYTTYFPEKVELKENETYSDLRVYAVINAKNAIWTTNYQLSTEEVSKALSEVNLKAATFSAVTQSVKDNEVLMFAQATMKETLTVNNRKDVILNAERCVSKLELYFTQRSANVNLKIKGITLEKLPETATLLPSAFSANPAVKSGGVNLYTPTDANGLPITTILTGETSSGDFSRVYDNANVGSEPFIPITITNPYLLEREGAGTGSGQIWNVITNKPDQVYNDPTTLPDAYILTLKYTYNAYDGATRQWTEEKEVTKQIALSRIKRNTRYRIFIRVHTDTPIEVNTSTVPWNEGKGEHYIDLSPGIEHDGVIEGSGTGA